MDIFFIIVGKFVCLVLFCFAIARLAGIITVDIKRED